MTNWPCKYFTPEEIACKGDGSLVMNVPALKMLDALRHIIGVPFTPNSAYRSPEHNKAVGGAPNSMHLQGRSYVKRRNEGLV